VTNTYEEEKPINQQVISSRIIFGQGYNSSGSNSMSNNQVSTPCQGGRTTSFKMAGHDPTNRFP
jgi:hypothetical protein